MSLMKMNELKLIINVFGFNALNIDLEIIRLINVMKNWIKSFALEITFGNKCPIKQSTINLMQKMVDVCTEKRKIIFWTKAPNPCLDLEIYKF